MITTNTKNETQPPSLPDQFQPEYDAAKDSVEAEALVGMPPSELDDEQPASMPVIFRLDLLGTEASDSDKLERCEEVLEGVLKRAFFYAGSVLRTIRDQRLYREKYNDFDVYTKERWGFDRTYAHRLIEAANVYENLTLTAGNNVVRPDCEAKLRPLTRLENAEDQCAAWDQAVAEADGEMPSAHQVQTVVERMKPLARRAQKAAVADAAHVADETPSCPAFAEPVPEVASVPHTASSIERVAAERQRQIEMEGFDAKHDARHTVADLLQMAGCYFDLAGKLAGSVHRQEGHHDPQEVPSRWIVESFGPWKPAGTTERNLEKGGASVIAAFDRSGSAQ